MLNILYCFKDCLKKLKSYQSFHCIAKNNKLKQIQDYNIYKQFVALKNTLHKHL